MWVFCGPLRSFAVLCGIYGRRALYLVEIADDLVEQTDALDAVSTDGVLPTELPEHRNRREHHHNAVVRLVVQILQRHQRRSNALRKTGKS